MCNHQLPLKVLVACHSRKLGDIPRLQLQYVLDAIKPRPKPVSVYKNVYLISFTLATESLGPRYNDPIAIAFSKSGCVHSRKTNVARCRIGNVGIKRTKNICRHSSRKTEVIDFAFTSAVTLEDYIASAPTPAITLKELTELVTISVTSRTAW